MRRGHCAPVRGLPRSARLSKRASLVLLFRFPFTTLIQIWNFTGRINFERVTMTHCCQSYRHNPIFKRYGERRRLMWTRDELLNMKSIRILIGLN